MLSKDYLETTFVDIRPGSTLERKLLAEAQDLHSASYSMDDEDDLLPDSDVRYPTCRVYLTCGDNEGLRGSLDQKL